MTDASAGWVALYSGGKDSYLAMAEAERSGRSVDRLLTVDAPEASYLYHVPTTAATAHVATAMGRGHVNLEVDRPGPPPDSSEAAAATEVAPLEEWLASVAGTDRAPAGLVSGVVASRYQYDLLQSLTDRFGIGLYTPLWERPAAWILEQILERDLSVDVVGVAAEGLGRDWLGRRLDDDAIERLRDLAERFGIHPAGEGGEFETLVVDAPLFSTPLRYRADPVWQGSHGHLDLRRAWLSGTAPGLAED